MITLLSRSLIFAIVFQLSSASTTPQTVCDSNGISGLYPNPDDTTCKQYVKCYISSGTLIGAFYNCSGSTLFNAAQQYCSTGYTCTATTTSTTTTSITTTTTTTTPETTMETTTEPNTETTTTEPITAQSICDSEGVTGLYPNPDDSLCKQYAKCFNNNGSLTGLFYNCTGTTLFNPSVQLCTSGYTCSPSTTQ